MDWLLASCTLDSPYTYTANPRTSAPSRISATPRMRSACSRGPSGGRVAAGLGSGSAGTIAWACGPGAAACSGSASAIGAGANPGSAIAIDADPAPSASACHPDRTACSACSAAAFSPGAAVWVAAGVARPWSVILPAATEPDGQRGRYGHGGDDRCGRDRGKGYLAGPVRRGQVHGHGGHRAGRGRRGRRAARGRARVSARAGGRADRRPGVRARGGRLPVLHHAVQGRAELVARRRLRRGVEQDVLAVDERGVVAPGQARLWRGGNVAGDLVELLQPAPH